MTIICLAGKAGSGKDTLADVLVKKHSFTRIALADKLRELCSKVFYIDYSYFNDHDKKDKQFDRVTLDFHHIDKIRDIVENEWGFVISRAGREAMEEYHGQEFNTPRELLRCIGTKLLRSHVRDDIWIVLAMSKIREIGAKVVITDCRFQNERDVFSKAGGLLVLIKRNDDGQKEVGEHDLGNEKTYDVIFSNNDTKMVFESSVDTWYTIMREELQNYRVFKYE